MLHCSMVTPTSMLIPAPAIGVSGKPYMHLLFGMFMTLKLPYEGMIDSSFKKALDVSFWAAESGEVNAFLSFGFLHFPRRV